MKAKLSILDYWKRIETWRFQYAFNFFVKFLTFKFLLWISPHLFLFEKKRKRWGEIQRNFFFGRNLIENLIEKKKKNKCKFTYYNNDGLRLYLSERTTSFFIATLNFFIALTVFILFHKRKRKCGLCRYKAACCFTSSSRRKQKPHLKKDWKFILTQLNVLF